MHLGGRQYAAPVAVVALLAAACGEGEGSGGAARAASSSATAAAAKTAPGETSVVSRSAPRWETVTTFEGSGPTDTALFAIIPSAIQWRVRWTCDAGSLTITSDPPPRKRRAVAEGSCPSTGEGFAIHTGPIRLTVDTPGPWAAVVDQQIDTPLAEAPLEGMAPETVVGQGAFAGVEMHGKGTARLHVLPDGRRLIRFEDDFEVSTNTDLFVWLSEAEAPTTSAEAVAAPYIDLGNLRSTLGSQNYEIPPNVPTDTIRSIVIWCEPVAIVYAVAPLARM